MAIKTIAWQGVMSDWGSGKFTLEDLANKWQIAYDTLIHKMDRDRKKGIPWKKAELAPLIQKGINESTVDMFVRKGLPKEKKIEAIVDGVTKPQGEFGPDWRARLGYIQEANKMTGDYAPVQVNIQGLGRLLIGIIQKYGQPDKMEQALNDFADGVDNLE